MPFQMFYVGTFTARSPVRLRASSFALFHAIYFTFYFRFEPIFRAS